MGSLMPLVCHVAATAGCAGRARDGIWPVRGRSRRRLLGFDADTADETGGQVVVEGLDHAADEAEDAIHDRQRDHADDATPPGNESAAVLLAGEAGDHARSEEHTYELKSLISNSDADFCLKKKIHLRIHK